jgi:hypothetical protein
VRADIPPFPSGTSTDRLPAPATTKIFVENIFMIIDLEHIIKNRFPHTNTAIYYVKEIPHLRIVTLDTACTIASLLKIPSRHLRFLDISDPHIVVVYKNISQKTLHTIIAEYPTKHISVHRSDTFISYRHDIDYTMYTLSDYRRGNIIGFPHLRNASIDIL